MTTPGAERREARRKLLERIIRVDHAGEFGAQRIYEGQIAVLGNTRHGDVLRHMKDQEEVHLTYFEDQIVDRKVRPTAFHPIWNFAGFALGAGTALLGEKAAMACTIAVEETIDEHYQAQLDALGDEEPELREAIAKFREEELEHRDIGIEEQGLEAPGYPILYRAIRGASKAAIWLSERV